MQKAALFILLILVGQRLAAQTTTNAQVNNLTFPSANNGFLANSKPNTSVGVDLYTGMAQVGISICTLPSRVLNIPISLNYTGGRGIKLQDYPSFVGLGWQLNAGGSISRVVRGYPDEQPNGYLGTAQWGKIVANWLGNNATLTTPQTDALKAIAGSGEPTADGEPDLFAITTPFFSAQFVFDENGNPVFSNYNGLKVIATNFNNSTNYANSTFEVIDGDGNQYYFGTTAGSVESTTTSIFGHPLTFPTTWYLTSIVAFNSADVITLNYTSAPANDVLSHYISGQAYLYTAGNPAVITNITPGDNTAVTSTLAPARFVSSIVTSQGQAIFNYVFTGRQDDPNGAYLYNISLYAFDPKTQSNSTALQTYYFSYGYFGSPSTDPNVLRLKLNGISVISNTTPSLTLESFMYNSTPLPARNSNAFDFWGYCTVTPTSDPLIYPSSSRAPDPAMSQVGVLTGITDVKGGTWNLSYELNDYNNGATNVQVGGLRVTEVSHTLPTGENLFDTYSYKIPGSGSSSGELRTSFYQSNTISPVSNIYYTYSESPLNVYDLYGNFVGYSYVTATNRNGGYIVSNFSNFSDQGFGDVGDYQGGGSLTLVTPLTSNAYKRGLLNYQAVYDATAKPISVTDYAYTAQTSPVLNKAWGWTETNYYYHVQLSNGSEGTTYLSNGAYHTNVENYLLTGTRQYDFDQVTGNSMLTTINYTYTVDPAHNSAQVHTITMTDSKSAIYTRTFYHPNDAGITLATSTDLSVINTYLLPANNTKALIQETDSRNGVIHQIYNSYSTIPLSGNTFIYPVTNSTYTGNTLVQQQFYNYDPNRSNLISSSNQGGKATSAIYGYNSTYPIATVINATNNYTAQTTEFYFEGFEQLSTATTGFSHSGNMYYNGNYTVPFTKPNARNYVIQWWTLVGGAWVFNQQAYTNGMVITGPVDDIRIFPSDALMTSYTYNPMVGKTSETDPGGKTIIYEYDGLGRLLRTRDQNNNILKQFDYEFQSAIH